MDSVTFEEFRKQAGKAYIVLIAIIIFCAIKTFKATSIEYIVILITSVLGIIGIRQLTVIATHRSMGVERKIKLWESILLDKILVFGLGIMSIYIFAMKGAYGLYLLFKDFSWLMLLFRIIIIIMSYQLVVSMSKIQTVFLSKELNE